jgi:hypothetical protein
MADTSMDGPNQNVMRIATFTPHGAPSSERTVDIPDVALAS